MPSCQNYFGKTFAHLAAAFAISAGSAEYSDIGQQLFQGSGRNLQLLFNLIIIIALTFAVTLTAPGGIPKYAAFIAFAFWLGQIFKPLVDRLQDKQQLQKTLALTAGVFFGMMAVGFYDRQNLLGLGPYLLAGLIGLIVAQLLLIFFATPSQKKAAFDAIRFIGVSLFAVLTAYDVQVIKKNKANCKFLKSIGLQPDYPVESINLLLDAVNIFGYIGGGSD